MAITKESILAANRKYYRTEKGLAKRRVITRRSARLRRESVIVLMGARCVQCGFSDIRALQIDHVNGGGAKERKQLTSPWTYLGVVRDSVERGENKYQLLCANCNVIKRIVNKEF